MADDIRKDADEVIEQLRASGARAMAQVVVDLVAERDEGREDTERVDVLIERCQGRRQLLGMGMDGRTAYVELWHGSITDSSPDASEESHSGATPRAAIDKLRGEADAD